jgi:hypothetical protein
MRGEEVEIEYVHDSLGKGRREMREGLPPM